jgi:hypothetical protein
MRVDYRLAMVAQENAKLVKENRIREMEMMERNNRANRYSVEKMEAKRENINEFISGLMVATFMISFFILGFIF